MKFELLKKHLIQIDKNPHLLLDLQSQIDENINSFMKNWYIFSNSPQDGTEYSYVWKLVHGWELQQLNKSLITSPQPQSLNSATLHKHPKQLTKEGHLLRKQNHLKYMSKSQLLIRLQNNLIWTNPSSNLKNIHQFKENFTLIFVITTSNIQSILNFITIAIELSFFRLITTQPIYRKVKKIISFLNTYQNNIAEPQTHLLKPDQYFQYANIVWLVRQNCWYQPSCDITLTFNQNKQTFLIQCQKLAESKLIYYGWKKNLISEQNYQKFIRQWDKSIITYNPETKDFFRIASGQKSNKGDKGLWYLHFIKKELIENLTNIEQDQIFACCELVELIPNQVIAKKNYLFDYMYILLQGQFHLTDQNNGPPLTKKASLKYFYGLKELTSRQPTYNFTLSSVTKGTIFRIQKSSVLFHLYDLLV